MVKYFITIDGPSACGKSSTADEVAERLGFDRINSGRIYRAITYILNENMPGFDIESREARAMVENIDLRIVNSGIIYKDEDISHFLHVEEIDRLVGIVAKEKYVRDKALKIQEEALQRVRKGAVLDGRDMGTVVLPNAFLKVFMTASPVIRAGRRQKELLSNDLYGILRDIHRRDDHDINRAHSPLRPAEDAMVINNDNLSLDDVAQMIVDEFNKRKSQLKLNKE